MKTLINLTVAFFAVLSMSLNATTIHVPADQPTIQAGIDAAIDGDTVLVAPGTYFENLTVQNRGITLASRGGRDSTVLRPSTLGHLVAYTKCNSRENFIEGITFSSVVNFSCVYAESGFVKIANNRFTAVSATEGNSNGTVDLRFGNFIVKDNVFDSNHVDDQGGGVRVISRDSTLVEGNLFRDNFARHGGGISVQSSHGTVVDGNLFVSNTVLGYGGAIFLEYSYGSTVYNNTIDSCKSPDGLGGGIAFFVTTNDTVFGNIITNCVGYGIWQGGSSGCSATYNDCYQNAPTNYQGISPGAGSISADPQFVGGMPFEYELEPTSPCINAGNPDPAYDDPDGTRNDIGAFPYMPLNLPPVIAPIPSLTRLEGDTVSFQVTATDPNLTIPFLIAFELPTGATFVDNGNGTGNFQWIIAPKQYGTFNISFIASDSLLSDTETVAIEVSGRPPRVADLSVEGSAIPMHVTTHVPTAAWQYVDFANDEPQLKFEIAVGTNNDWTFAEMWNPAPFVSSDTFVVYAGAPLIDGSTYWLRLRVNNGLVWSNWKEISFRMNSVPTIPALISPADYGVVTSAQPVLKVSSSFDTEGDPLTYAFQIAADSNFAALAYTANTNQDTLIVGAALTENARYWWRAKTSDGFEESAFSTSRSFFVNAVNTAPTAFDLAFPANSQSPPLAKLTPQFGWKSSYDIDPFDSVHYSLIYSIKSNFSIFGEEANLKDTVHTLTDSLEWGTQYWWKVKALDKASALTWSSSVYSFRTMTLGDADGNGRLNIGDVVFLVNFIFAGGAAPEPIQSGDVNCDKRINLGDCVYIINYIFGDGTPPCDTF